MNMEFISLLKKWNLDEHIDAFISEGITDLSFPLLDDETINAILKKCGPRLVFKSKFKQYYSQNHDLTDSQTDISVTSGSSNVDSIQEESSFSIENLDNTVIELIDVDVIKSSESMLESTIFNPSQWTSVAKSVETTPEPPAKKLASSSIFHGGLENILSKSPEGRLALINKHRKLTNDLRQKMSKVVVNELLSAQFKKYGTYELGRDSFVRASQEIVKVFPGEELETYYTPFKSKKTGLRQPARGKLWSRYLNVKGALRIAEQSIPKENKIEESSPCDEEVKNDLTFLHSAVEPFPKVLTAWENTYHLRSSLYKSCGIEQIFKDFPCLRTPYGLDLLESDFNQLYEAKASIVYSNWPKICGAILKEAEERRIVCKEQLLDDSARAFLLLPYLFSPVNIKKTNKGKQGWRPTRIEIQESIFFHTESFTSLEEIINRRKLKLETFKLPLQPFACVIDGIYFIILNESRYKYESCIRCLEVLYKTIHALNLEYASESKHIWNFIQECVFEMPVTNKNSTTACVIADINYHLSQED